MPTLLLKTQKDWEEWLEEHRATAGAWLKLAKKDSGKKTLSYAEALDVALCFGWIDGQKKALDADFWLQKFTPRGPRSIWSKVNRDKVTQLIEKGRMRPEGLAEVERAKRDGRWDAAYDSQSKASIPPDLQAALDESPRAREFFATLDSKNRYAILFRIQTVKKAETRAAKIEKFVAMLAENKKLHP